MELNLAGKYMHWNILHIIFYIWLLFTIIYGGFGLTLFLMQSKLLYYPVKSVVYTPEELGLEFEEVILETSDDVKISGWYIPAPDAKFTILFCHGNGGNIMHRLDSINLFYNLGVNCFIFDYRGYGKSGGKTTEQGTYDDATAAYNWLREKKEIEPENIIIFGRSLGGSIAAWLGAKVPSNSVVIESTFTSYVDIGRKFYWYMPVRFFARYSYRTIDYVKDIKCPVMFIHSRDDELMPYEFARQLYAEANEPKEFVEINGGHNDGFLVSAETYKEAWRKWLKFLEQRQREAEQHRAS